MDIDFEKEVLKKLHIMQTAIEDLKKIKGISVKATVHRVVKDHELLTCKKVIERWNNFSKTHPHFHICKITKLTDKIKSQILARTKDPEFELDKLFKIILISPWLIGRINRNYRITFDYLFRNENNWRRILSGEFIDDFKRRDFNKIVNSSLDLNLFNNNPDFESKLSQIGNML